MRISERLASQAPCFSFEFFAPKTPEGRRHLLAALDDLTALSPGFISVTCGASGSKRAPSLDLLADLAGDRRFVTMAHLTCLGQSELSLRRELDRIRELGIENVLALRGDPPKEELEAARASDGPKSGAEFAGMIAGGPWNFCVGGAAYPEVHPRAVSASSDLAELKKKAEAGIEFAITQLFFINGRFADFTARARDAGISLPIVPGIMPITEASQAERFQKQCGVAIPQELTRALDMCQGNAGAIQDFGVAYATGQCLGLMRRGVRHLHFFTLNKSPATRAIVTALRALSESA